MTIHEAIKRRREELGWSHQRVADEVSVLEGLQKPLTWQTVQQWERSTAPKRTRLPIVARALKLSLADLMSLAGLDVDANAAADQSQSNISAASSLRPAARLPVVGEVKGGENGYLEELQYPTGHGDGFVEHPTRDPGAYALRVRGDSMHPRFRAGEFVIVEPGIQPQDGDDVIVSCTDGQKLLKQLNWIRDGEVQLLSINNGYAPLTLPLSKVESIQLVAGRVRRSALRHD